MHIGYIVGIIISVSLIIYGIVAAIYAKVNQKEYKWAKWLIIVGIVALISAFINYNLSNVAPSEPILPN